MINPKKSIQHPGRIPPPDTTLNSSKFSDKANNLILASIQKPPEPPIINRKKTTHL
jgi:hypothetical protein